jgi:hypothetical protein
MKNRLIYLLIISLSLTTMLVSCEEEGILPVNLPTAISFNLESDTVIVQPGGSTYDLELQSTTTSDTDRTYSITINETSTGVDGEYTLSSTSITIPAGELKGSTAITFDYDVIPIGIQRSLNFNLNEITGSSFLNSSRKSTTILYSALCLYNELKITFVFDDYPQEAYWILYDSDDIFLDGDGYSGSNCDIELASNPKTFCLEDGDYKFVMGDCYGDGGTAYTIELGEDILYSSTGIAGEGETITFSLP